MHYLFCVVLCIVFMYMCTVLLPPGSYPIAVKHVIRNHIIPYIIESYESPKCTACTKCWFFKR